MKNNHEFVFKRKPHQHQLEAFNRCKDERNFALLMEQGTGKTKIIIDTARYLYEKGRIDMMIVLSWPKGIHINWTAYELENDMDINRDKVRIFTWNTASYTTRKFKDSIKFFKKDFEKLRIASFNIEATRSENGKKVIAGFINSSQKGVLLVIDQSACIKSPNANQSKFCIKLSKMNNIKYKRILDGAPNAEGLHEFYNQFRFLSPNILGHTTKVGFYNEFCVCGFFNQITAYKNEEELIRRISAYSYRCEAKDCQDLPERIYKPFYFDLSKHELSYYEILKHSNIVEYEHYDPHDFAGSFEKLTLVIKLAMVKALKLQQITSGFIKNRDKVTILDRVRETIVNYPSRINAFKQLMPLLKNDQALIFCRFKEDILLLKEVLGNMCIDYYGDTPNAVREDNKKRFLNGEYQFLIGTPKALGLGHTFVNAKHVIFYNNDYASRLRVESEKRVHRMGQKDHVIVWDIVANNTIDIDILECLKKKKNYADYILNRLENNRRQLTLENNVMDDVLGLFYGA